MRATVDVNKPVDETSAARVNMMFQEGDASTRDQTDVLDFGFAPSFKFGIGTPTEVTLYALIQQNRDQVDYGVPPLNGFPADVPRNTAYGYDNDYTTSTVIALGSTVDHKFDKRHRAAQPDAVQLRQHEREGDLTECDRHRPQQRLHRHPASAVSHSTIFRSASKAATATSTTSRSTTRPS